MSIIKIALQELLIVMVRPLVYREIPGWGALYNILIGDYRRNSFWQGARRRIDKGKLNGCLMDLDLSQWADRIMFFLGRWYDLATQKLVQHVLKEGDQVVDVGANVGCFAFAARSAVGSKGYIHAFEPNPETRKKLARNIELNGFSNIQVHPCALGATEGRFTLYVPRINSGEASLACFTEGEYQRADYDEVSVEVKVGDEILGNVKPRLVKIDVEGAEVGVLMGLSKLIETHRPLIIAEYVPQHIQRFGKSFADIKVIAAKSGYEIFRMSLAKSSSGYDVALAPVGDGPIDGAFDVLLGHQDDPYIQSIRARLQESGKAPRTP